VQTLVVEGSLHATFLKDFGVDGSSAEASPVCFAYTNFLLAQAHGKSLPVAMASVLPCFVIYNEATSPLPLFRRCHVFFCYDRARFFSHKSPCRA
jgi:thiaminase